MRAEVATEIKGRLDGKIGKILITESHDLAFSHKACELIFTSFTQLAQLDAANLAADGGSEIYNFALSGKEVGIRRIGIYPVVMMLKWLESRVFLFRVPGGEVVGVLFIRR